MKHVNKSLTAVFGAVGLIALTACAGSGPGSSDSTGSDTSESSIALPASVEAKRALDVAVYVPYPPYTTIGADGQPGGLEPDLLRAVAGKLGVTANFHSMKFEAMIPSVVSGRNDVMIGVMADTEERRNVVSFTDLYTAGFKVVTAAGNPASVDATNLCGTTLGETPVSVQHDIVSQLSEDCVAAGNPPIEILDLVNPADNLVTITNGRTDGTLIDAIMAADLVKTNPDFAALDEIIEGPPIYTGWLYEKNNDVMINAVCQAVTELMDDGTWGEIMTQYGADQVALDPIRINTEPADC
ncbi:MULTISPECIES: transporter substrate-binding domain-containing protein [Nocardiaceae]|uniref:transporter substrate-binding domain-containing protein n=1 Tax=Nocardiaceae TaxID=85025 RepID=UPI000522EEC9|nr:MULTISPECIES: transporter substrate-binding domain-containing protein [Rhodococcus]